MRGPGLRSVAVLSRHSLGFADSHVLSRPHRQAARCACIAASNRDPCALSPGEEDSDSARAVVRGLHCRRGGRGQPHTRGCGAARTLDLASGPGRESRVRGTSPGGHQRCRRGAPGQTPQSEQRYLMQFSAFINHAWESTSARHTLSRPATCPERRIRKH